MSSFSNSPVCSYNRVRLYLILTTIVKSRNKLVENVVNRIFFLLWIATITNTLESNRNKLHGIPLLHSHIYFQ